ncbi:MAG TPA: hypothetical protein VLA04_03675, partial [Verrucomicrobiae bacterium]|nr:hypothetical protein [Verrucomicrobiae bacterium]
MALDLNQNNLPVEALGPPASALQAANADTLLRAPGTGTATVAVVGEKQTETRDLHWVDGAVLILIVAILGGCALMW